MRTFTGLLMWVGGALLVTFVGIAIINRVAFLRTLAYPGGTA